jgi:hypothetical protein
MHLLDPPDRLGATVIAALQTDDHAVVGYLSLDADINFASFTRHQIDQFSRLRDCGFACDVFLDEEDHGPEGISSPGHEATICGQGAELGW